MDQKLDTSEIFFFLALNQLPKTIKIGVNSFFRLLKVTVWQEELEVLF